MVASPRHSETILRRNPWLVRGFRGIGRICFWPFFRLRVSGTQYLPAEAAFVLLPKHQRWEDIPLLGLASPRPLYYVAKNELFKNRASRWLIQSLGGIPLNRQRPIESRASLSATLDALNMGEGLVVFPEGTYYHHHMGPARPGLVKFLIAHGAVQFIPVGVHYGKDSAPAQVRVSFGQPLYPDAFSSPQLFLEKAMRQIAALSGLQHSPAV